MKKSFNLKPETLVIYTHTLLILDNTLVNLDTKTALKNRILKISGYIFYLLDTTLGITYIITEKSIPLKVLS